MCDSADRRDAVFATPTPRTCIQEGICYLSDYKIEYRDIIGQLETACLNK